MTFKDYLNLTAWDVSEMSEGELRKAVSTLNDVANKRIKRLEASGLAESSPAYQALSSSGNTRFRVSRSEHDMKELKSKYLQVRNFLDTQETKTGNIKGTREFVKNVKSNLDKILNDAMQNPENLDKRYKTPTIKKSVKKQLLKDFWEEYNKWKEIQKQKNPSKYAHGSPIEYVDEFYEDYYEEGNTTTEDYEQGAIEDYEEEQRRQQSQWDELLSSGDDDEGRVDAPKPSKHKGKGIENGDIKVEFEKVKIF